MRKLFLLAVLPAVSVVPAADTPLPPPLLHVQTLALYNDFPAVVTDGRLSGHFKLKTSDSIQSVADRKIRDFAVSLAGRPDSFRSIQSRGSLLP